MIKRKAIVSVISDLVSDQRVHRISLFLQEEGFDVTLVGRKHDDSLPLEKRSYHTERISLLFRKGVLFYTEFNIRLFFKLLFSSSTIYVSNDLDTLLPNYLVAKLKGKPLFYDSHEYFTGMPELEGRSFKRNAWRSLERWLLPKVKNRYTVNESIAAKYKQDYGVEMKVVRNLPVYEPVVPIEKKLFPENKIILLLQGAGINAGRGAEELIESMRLLPENMMLFLIGSGEAWTSLKLLAKNANLTDRVKFIEKVPFQQLRNYTTQSHLGFSLDKPFNINYQLSLPNKIFDYIHAGVPVIASGIFEVRKIVEGYHTGIVIKEVTPENIAAAVLTVMNDRELYNRLKENCRKAALELSWQQEKNTLKEIYRFA